MAITNPTIHGKEFDREARVNLAEELRGIVRNYLNDYRQYIKLSTARVRDNLPAGKTLPKYADGEHIPTREYLDAWAELASKYREQASAAVDGMRHRVRLDKAAAPDASELAVIEALDASDASLGDIVGIYEVLPKKWLTASALRGVAKRRGHNSLEVMSAIVHPYDDAEQAFEYLDRGVEAIFKNGLDIEGWAKSVGRAPTATENYLVPFEEGRTATVKDQFDALVDRQQELFKDSAVPADEATATATPRVEFPDPSDVDEPDEATIYTTSGEVPVSDYRKKQDADKWLAAQTVRFSN